MHTTVASTERDLRESGWDSIYNELHGVEEAREGDVIIWSEAIQADGKSHEHIGFYIGDNQAVSNRDTDKTPQIHPFDYREIKAIYRSNKLKG